MGTTRTGEVELIYCADGNQRFAQIALDLKFVYGARLPATVYYQPEFIDQDWKNPDRDRYMACLKKYKPNMASILDWEHSSQLSNVLSWANQASEFVKKMIIIIPKIKNAIHRLPETINNIPIRLGFSYPTGYGNADFDILFEMVDWPNGIHILGGPPHAILAMKSGYFKVPRHSTPNQTDFFIQQLDIRSADCNYHLNLANRGLVWQGNANGTCFNHVSLKELNGGKLWGDGSKKSGANYEAFRRSCENIMAAWGKILKWV